MELHLWFQHNRSCELVQVRFQRTQAPPRISYRGKALAFDRDAGLFQWSAAVKAFAQLAVGTRIGLCEAPLAKPFLLEGEAGSLAATLDYAIAKATSWIVDLFGRETSGKSYARLVFRRENSERKRPGPVRISLNTQLFDSTKLRIFLDGTELLTLEPLTDLYEKLSSDPKATKRKIGSTHSGPVFTAAWFRALLQKEVRFNLEEVELLERMGIAEACEKVAETKSLPSKAVTAIKEGILSQSSTPSRAVDRRKVSASQGTLLVACPPTAVACLAIFHHLRQLNRLKVVVHASFPSARAILETEKLSSYSAIVLSWGAASKLYRTEGFKRFSPIMLLPRTSFGLVLRREFSSPREIERVLLATEPDGYPISLFNSAQKAKLLKQKVDTIAASFSEVMSFLPQKGEAAIAGFPISYLIAKRHNAKVLWDRESQFRLGDNILFARNTGTSLITPTAVTRAWFDLLEDKIGFSTAIEKIYSEVDFINYLYRIAALYRLDGVSEAE